MGMEWVGSWKWEALPANVVELHWYIPFREIRYNGISLKGIYQWNRAFAL